MESLAFGSLISATDPVSTLAVFSDLRVDPTLFYVVFGESVRKFSIHFVRYILFLLLLSSNPKRCIFIQVLNDAIGIVLFKTTSKYIGYDIGPGDTVAAIVDFCICLLGSCIIGYVMGLLSAYIFKKVDFHGDKLALVAAFVSLVYIPFFLSGRA